MARFWEIQWAESVTNPIKMYVTWNAQTGKFTCRDRDTKEKYDDFNINWLLYVADGWDFGGWYNDEPIYSNEVENPKTDYFKIRNKSGEILFEWYKDDIKPQLYAQGIREVYLQRVVYVMDNNTNIHCIRFKKSNIASILYPQVSFEDETTISFNDYTMWLWWKKQEWDKIKYYVPVLVWHTRLTDDDRKFVYDNVKPLYDYLDSRCLDDAPKQSDREQVADLNDGNNEKPFDFEDLAPDAEPVQPKEKKKKKDIRTWFLDDERYKDISVKKEEPSKEENPSKEEKLPRE